ncbi:putative Ig domain-containing protein [Luteolibacter sp. AS25]|uniref:putative Ig domain-containing protein n=1 Tax=Luteolibacter sp. AS25 TaxID=3135776 RepID=UPI00398B006C
MKYKRIYTVSAFLLSGALAQADTIYQDKFDGDGLSTNSGAGGGAVNRTINTNAWDDTGDANFIINGTGSGARAILYSANTFQSDTGFKLTVQYTAGSIASTGANSLAFGLISDDTNISTLSGDNPFRANNSVYSIGANVTAVGGVASQGLNFTNGSTRVTLDQSGTRTQFVAGETCEVTIEIGVGGYWCYRINGEYEASGALPEGFDLSKNYHVAVYGQDDNGGAKSIQSIQLETAYAQGERAESIRGGWTGGQGDVENIKTLKTIHSTIARLNEGAIGSGTHNAPHNLLESIALGLSSVGGAEIDAPVPTWGDLSLGEPQNDPFLAEILGVREVGIGVKVYSNSENFNGTNTVALQAFTDRWKNYCDTNPEVQAFINSQPYHTGIWNSTTQQYEDATATFPDRKYMFCYAEYVLKEYALRYGQYVSSWVFDSADDMGKNGDSAGTGVIEQERIFQAFANAIHAGNPEIPVSFNRGRMGDDLITDSSFPYSRPSRFDDFTFGHAYNGNSSHASTAVNPTRNESIFVSNYRHVQKMTEKNGFVHDGGIYTWDDGVVGNFHSKLGTANWQYGGTQAWTQADFNQWNLEAMQAGGHMTWEGSIVRGPETLRGWALTQLQELDAHLAEFQNPGPPSWARHYTWLPDADDSNYNHTLVENTDFWDPEGDNITAILPSGNAPSWLSISESPSNSGNWVLSGVPTDVYSTSYTFDLILSDSNGMAGSREVTLSVNVSALVYNNTPREWLASYGIEASDTGAQADTDGDGIQNWQEYQNGTDPAVNDSPAGIRVTEYYLTTGDFTGTQKTLVLDQNLADDYFILVRGSRDGNGTSLPDNDYARVTGVPYGGNRYAGDMVGSGNNNQIILTRSTAAYDWEGVVTVVECTNPTSAAGFDLVDIASVDISGNSGTEVGTAWNDINQVVLFGGYRGGGVSYTGTPTTGYDNASAHTRFYPTGSNTISWNRNSAGETLLDVTATTFVVEWGSEWNVQHSLVTGSNGGNGANATGEYTSVAINPVSRDNTWVWGTGTRLDSGVGDGAEGCLVTLGNGVNQNATESTVAVGSEYTDTYWFDVYTMTHPDLSVDNRFKTDGNVGDTDLAVTVNSAPSGARFGWVYNGCNATGDSVSRAKLWSRYTDNDEVTISRGYSGQNFPAWIQGIDFSGLNN